jgi:HD superfamily phosphodiesterase
MNLKRIVESAEKQYKQILEEYFVSVYNERSLPSHGIDHHRRVWIYSQEILKIFPLKNKKHLSALTSELIIASYLHDIGMSVDAGTKHGKYSKDLAARFLALNNLRVNDHLELLEAIENHDNKEYISKESRNDLLTVLSVSDDLDAFGFIGVYRYTEIYLIRGTEPVNIGHQVKVNARKRFENFEKTAGKAKKIIEKHNQRYLILDNFFTKYNEQLLSYQFGTSNPSGYCGVIELIGIMVNNKMELNELFTYSEKYSADPVINWFFSALSSELLVEH